MGDTKKFTILHSNDMHGDFLAEERGELGHLIGELSLLSGYINQVRREEKNVLYCTADDMDILFIAYHPRTTCVHQQHPHCPGRDRDGSDRPLRYHGG
jgi:hypothetical protein